MTHYEQSPSVATIFIIITFIILFFVSIGLVVLDKKDKMLDDSLINQAECLCKEG